MRTLPTLAVLAFVAALVVLGRSPHARAEEGDVPAPVPAPVQPDAHLAELLQRMERVERQNAYLLSRERALTAYVTGHERTAGELKRLAEELRAGGFAAAANPSPVRERLLRGLEQLADALRKGLPTVSSAEAELLASAAR